MMAGALSGPQVQMCDSHCLCGLYFAAESVVGFQVDVVYVEKERRAMLGLHPGSSMVVILFISQGPLGVVLAASITEHFVVFQQPRGRAIIRDTDSEKLCETHSTSCDDISLVSILLFL
jgi:hypothetical protein